MDEYGEIFETFIEPDDITYDLMDVKEIAKINGIIQKLRLYDNKPEELTKVYSSILLDDNVAYILIKVSQDKIFSKQFPEFYELNQYNENLINCQQNSSYHRYGVFKHILTTIELVGEPLIQISEWQKRLLKWTMFLHDIGKPFVKVIAEDGTESFAGHDEKSLELAEGILKRLHFEEEEKRIILTLIKYHDKFLNEGEVTEDNLKFLSSELNNDKELFYMLINVKEADAKAKSIEAYNTFKLVSEKYVEFAKQYFIFDKEKEIDVEVKRGNRNEAPRDDSFFTAEELEELLDSVLSRKSIKTLYQPIVDLKTKSVHGYEVFTRIQSNKNITLIDFFNYSKDVKKYNKLQQALLINGIEDFMSISSKDSKRLFLNCDINGYNKYVNKPRLYDMMSKINLVIEFQDCDRRNFELFKTTIDTIHKNGGFVAIDNFGVGNFTMNEINALNIDYIIPDISLIIGIENDEERQRYISALVTYTISKNCNLLALGVETEEAFKVLKSLGVRYFQGFYFSKPNEKISPFNRKLKEIIENVENDSIS